MAGYAELDEIIGKMKRAAIDCWMADQGFDPVWGNEGTYAKWGWAPYQYFRPEADGSGGGESVGYGDGVSCVAQFDAIRSTIDGLVERWRNLPDGSACATPQSAANAAAAQLGASGTDPNAMGGSDIATSNGTVAEVVLNRMDGSFRDPFVDKYYTQFSAVHPGIGQAAKILQANYAACGAMWPAVGDDVATICDSARVAWETQAKNSSAATATFQLTVLAAVAGAVGSIVTAGAGTVAAVAGLGGVAFAANTALAGITANAAISGSSYDTILKSLTYALKKLDETITAQEKALATMLTSAESTIRGDLASYNLDASTLGEYPVRDGAMRIDKTDANIVSRNMGRIEETLSGARSALGSAPASAPTPRSAGIGWSSNGTHAEATALHALVVRCLDLTIAEYSRGHDLFDATVADYFQTDANAEQTVRTLLADERLSADLGV